MKCKMPKNGISVAFELKTFLSTEFNKLLLVGGFRFQIVLERKMKRVNLLLIAFGEIGSAHLFVCLFVCLFVSLLVC